jgi:hypothetical protein
VIGKSSASLGASVDAPTAVRLATAGSGTKPSASRVPARSAPSLSIARSVRRRVAGFPSVTPEIHPCTLAALAVCHAAPGNGHRSSRSDTVRCQAPERFHTVWSVFGMRSPRQSRRRTISQRCTSGAIFVGFQPCKCALSLTSIYPADKPTNMSFFSCDPPWCCHCFSVSIYTSCYRISGCVFRVPV